MSATLFQGLKGKAVAVSAGYVCDGSESCVRVTTGATDRTVTLPAASKGPQIVFVEKVDAGAGQVTVQGAGADRVSGQPFVLSAQWGSVVVMSDGATSWEPLVA